DAVAPVVAHKPDVSTHLPALNGLRVLVVDDDAEALEVMRRQLEGVKVKIECAGSVREALAVRESFRPAVLISDIAMPEEGGEDRLRRDRGLEEERGARTPVVALTAYARNEDRARATREGFDAHLSKPAELSTLTATLADVVERYLPGRLALVGQRSF